MVSGNNYTRVNYNYSAKKAHPRAHRNIVPRVVLMKTYLRPLNTARPVNTTHPKNAVYSARPVSFSTAKGKVNTARPNTAVVNVVRANQGHPQKEDQGYVDSGCSRHMTGNMSYLLDFKEFDEGYVTFGGGAKGGRITIVAGTTYNDFIDGSLFNSSLKDVSNKEPQPSNDAKKKDDEGGIEIHTNHNVADLLTKAFDVGRFQYPIATANDVIQVSIVGLPYYTVDNGEQEITATVDGKEFIIIEASVRRHLQLADVDGEGSGHPSEPQPPPSTAQPTNEEPIPNVVSSLHQKTQTPRQDLNQVTELPQTSEPIPNVADGAVYEEWDDRVERVTTTAASLDAEQASGNINRTQSTTMPNVPLPKGIGAGVHTLGSEEGSMTLLELMVCYTTLSKKGESLEVDLKQTKKLDEGKIVVLDDEEDLEDSSKQGRMIEEIDQDVGVTLVTPIHSLEDQPEDQLGVFSVAKVLADAAKENVHTYTRRRRAVSVKPKNLNKSKMTKMPL
ncbi:hypothetical protein Tco_0184745 [Tanacetum coccineum]